MTALTTEQFAAQFFSRPNLAWPDMDPSHPSAGMIRPFLAALSARGECPVILPRRDAEGRTTILYVMCWDTAHAGRVRALLEAAVAHHWCPFDGRVARLDPSDPIDASVLALVGPGTSFVLRPTSATARATLVALQRLVATVGETPLRRPNLARPIGRMLREFELALAAGAVDASGTLLREIEQFGGISHENVSFLQIRRLAQLGKERELLAHSSLPTLVYAEPPRLVREAVVGAWTRVNLDRPVRPEDVGAAVAAVRDADPDVAMLVDESLAGSEDSDASTFCALVAIARKDVALIHLMRANPGVDPGVLQWLEPARRQVERDLEEPTQVIDAETKVVGVEPDVQTEAQVEGQVEDQIDKQRAIASWMDWVARLGTPDASALDESLVRDWTAAWSVDADLADLIDALPSIATDDLLAGVAVFLETDDPARPAARTAAALLGHYLVSERFMPHDLAAICALLEIFLRGGPAADAYRSLLGDIRSFAPQWVAVSSATRVLDIADAVARGPVVDTGARSDFVATLVSPLNQLRHRLAGSLRSLAELVTKDADLDYDWTVPVTDDGPADVARTGRILIYSLDTGTLARVSKAIELQWPGVRVHASADRDGNPALKQQARNSDLIVLATRRATHAGTGFITDNAGDALIRYADGSGSASMLRAIESGLSELAG